MGAGAALLVLDSMKMEVGVAAPRAAVVARVFVRAGDHLRVGLVGYYLAFDC